MCGSAKEVYSNVVADSASFFYDTKLNNQKFECLRGRGNKGRFTITIKSIIMFITLDG